MPTTLSVVRVPKGDAESEWVRLVREGNVVCFVVHDGDEAVFYVRGGQIERRDVR